MGEKDKYANLKPVAGESQYVEFDEEFGYWGVFGNQSGFCWGLFPEESLANDFLEILFNHLSDNQLRHKYISRFHPLFLNHRSSM